MADSWWSQSGYLNLLQSAMNPWRIPYFARITKQLGIAPRGKRVLDVGCGGGLVAEEFAAMGFAVSGIDRSEPSLKVACAHAARNGLTIDYHAGDARRLPFRNDTFAMAFCCDVLEHLHNWNEAIAEIARVLIRGGAFFYDTINRTLASKIRVIKMAQEWRWSRYAPPNTHVWDMFITPEELSACLERNGFRNQEVVGTAPGGNPVRALWITRQYSQGKISAAEFGEGIRMREGRILSGSYMGYAVKS
jgi:2-polyprenyl-6-hydroxyphenyl methylase/3-demethylubiquinone-9 3-methyltransferase